MLFQPFTTNILIRKRKYTGGKKLSKRKIMYLAGFDCQIWIVCIVQSLSSNDDRGGDLEKKKKRVTAWMCIGWVHTHPLKGFQAITHSLRFWCLIEGSRSASCRMLRQVWKACQSWPNSPLSISVSLCRTLLKVCITPSTSVLKATYKYTQDSRHGVYPNDCHYKF